MPDKYYHKISRVTVYSTLANRSYVVDLKDGTKHQFGSSREYYLWRYGVPEDPTEASKLLSRIENLEDKIQELYEQK